MRCQTMNRHLSIGLGRQVRLGGAAGKAPPRLNPARRVCTRRRLPCRASLDKYCDAQWDNEGMPGCNFFKVEAIFRPWRLPGVIKRLNDEGIKGVTATDVRGLGVQGDLSERYGGSAFGDAALVVKTKLEIVVMRAQVQDVISMIIEEARTGEIGDGKIFVQPVCDVIRIRTGECGLQAEHMDGGRSDSHKQSV
ncbi:hypothetical protein BSKO_01683 [Bryopsis sp. KO-2023]|nr:hypothetical protein BSKO_01683 [Bryopsis sp. KO-2023]